MKRILVMSAAIASFLGLGLAAPAFGAVNPSGSGPPNQTCQIITALPNGHAPGNSASSQGSVFNETGPGTGGFHYNLVGAPSQYDVACYQVSQPH
jgi:hypothetical protein